MKIVKSNNGFVLAEAIITSVFVLGVFTFVVANVFPLIGRYEKYLRFDNLQDVYLARNVYDVAALYSNNVYGDFKDKSDLVIINTGSENDVTDTAASKFCNISSLNDNEKSTCLQFIGKDGINVTGYVIQKPTSSGTRAIVDKTVIHHRGMKAYANYFNNSNKCKFNDVVVLLRFNMGKKASYSSFCVKAGV